MAESSSAYTASGWHYNQDGTFTNKETKGTEQLRNTNAAIGAAASALYAAPLFAPGTAGGYALGNAAGSMAIGTALEEGQRAVTGQSTGDIVSGKLQEYGVPTLIADMARPEYYINPTGAVAKSVWNAGSKTIKRTTPKRISNNSNFGAFGTTKTSEVAKDAFIDNPVALHMSRIENGGWDKLTKMHKDLGYDGRIYYDYANGWSADYLADSPRISVYMPEYNFGIPVNGKVNESPLAFYRALESKGGGMAKYSSGNVGVSKEVMERFGLLGDRQ